MGVLVNGGERESVCVKESGEGENDYVGLGRENTRVVRDDNVALTPVSSVMVVLPLQLHGDLCLSELP